MKRSVIAMSLVLAATLLGCGTSAPEAPAPPDPATIQLERFTPAESGERAPTPFRKTGDLYVLETGCDCILAITPAGDVSVAVTTQEILDATGADDVSMSRSGIVFDATGTMYFTEVVSQAVLRKERGGKLGILASGETLRAATGQPEVDPEGLAWDTGGRLYVNDNASDSVLEVDAVTGAVSVLASGKELGALVGLETANLASGLIVARGGIVFTTNEDDPQAIIGIERGEGLGVFATSHLFDGLGGYMVVDGNGELVVMDSGASVVFQISTTGDVKTFLSEQQLEAPIGGADGRYPGGIAFDADENFYVAEANENHILRFDSRFRGTIWVNRAAIQVATRETPDLDGGIAFAPLLDEE